MGTTTLIDIIGSMVIGSMLLLTALQMNDTATKNTFQCQENLTVQQNLTAIIQNIQWDFEKIGYCKEPTLISDPARYILYGDNDSISFSADLYNTGTLNTVSWYLGGYIKGPNPRIRKLCRKVDNNPPSEANLGVTQFSLQYFDAAGISIPLVLATRRTRRISPSGARQDWCQET